MELLLIISLRSARLCARARRIKKSFSIVSFPILRVEFLRVVPGVSCLYQRLLAPCPIAASIHVVIDWMDPESVAANSEESVHP